jgi:hypothetical protein
LSGDYPHLLRLPIQSKTSATNLANLRRLNQKINERIREIRGKKILSLPYADLWVITRAAIPNLNLTISTQSRQDAKILTFPRRNRQEYHLAQGQS